MDEPTVSTVDALPSLRALFDAMDLGVVVQGQDARIIAANPAAGRILGLTRDELLGRSSFDPRWRAVREDGTDLPGAEHPPVVAMRTGAPVRGVSVGVIHPPTGIRRWLLVDSFPESRPGEATPGQAVTLLRDVTQQRAAEEEHHAQQQTLRAIAESSQDWIWAIDLEGRHTYSNRAVQAILGLSPEEFKGRGLELLHPEDRERVGALWPEWVAGRRGWRNVLLRWRAADGSYRLLESSAVPILTAQGELAGFRGVDRDVTDQRAAEAALRESEARYRALFDAMHEGFAFHEVIRDAAGEVVDYRYLDLNPAFERLTGLRREATVGRTVREVIPGIEPEWIRFFGNVALTGVPAEQERHVRELDRYYRAQAFSPRPGTFAVVFEETTAQRRAQRELERRERLYNDLVETATDLVWRCDAEGRYTFLNKAWERAFGYALDEMLGRPFTDFMSPGQAARDRSTFARLLAETGRIDGYETVHRRKDGTPVHLVFNATPFQDEAGRIVGTQGTAHDVTERRRLEEERLSLERQLLHAQKLESLGVLAGGIAHDFNNLLMAILGNADLAMAAVDRGSPAYESLAAINQATARAADLARQMLAYAGRGRFVVGPVDLNELLAEMLHMLEVSVSKRAALRLRPHRPLPTVEADATQLRQVVMNLVINASEAIGEQDGIIAVSTGVRACDHAYLKAIWPERELPEGPYVELEVADTGCGMARETLERLFDPFFSTKFAGRGLGMSAVLGIVRGHHGAITVDSVPGQGTTFRVLLPASAKAAAQGGAGRVRGDWSGAGKVLLVDDEASVREVGARMLRALGFTPVTAGDGVEGLEAFRREPGAFAAVILDLTMPRLGGEACFRELRRLSPDARVLIASGFGEQEVAQLAVEGLAGFIAKPYALSTLREALRRALS